MHPGWRRFLTTLVLGVAVLVGVVSSARADAIVVIGDPNLRAAVAAQLVSQGQIPAGSDGTTITPSDMYALTMLHAPDSGIVSLDGLQEAVNLGELDLSGNEITTATPLAVLTSLSGLDLGSNRIDLAPGSPALSAIAAIADHGTDVTYQPQRATVCAPSLSTAPARGRTAGFAARVSPSGAVVSGAAEMRLYHLETHSVTKVVDGVARTSKVNYWRLRTNATMRTTPGGALAATSTLSCAGKWQVQVVYTGAPDYDSCTSTAVTFTVQDPRIESAIRWARARRGWHSWDSRCMKFASDAYQYGAHTTVTRYRTAKQAADALHASRNKGLNAPRGALVFFHSWHGRVDLGHVGISLGNGMMVNSWGGYGVKVMPIKCSLSYIGWAAPPVSPSIVDWKQPPAQ